MTTALRGQTTRPQFDAGRAAWQAAGGQDGGTAQNMTPAQMAAIRPPLPLASATGGPTPGNAAGGAPNAWNQPGARLQNFGPGNDLRGTSILPQNSARTNTAQGQADNAFGDVANFQLPQWNSLNPYSSRNSMDGIQGLSTAPVAGPDFGGARGAVAGALPRATQFTDAAAGALGSVGGVSFDGSAAENTWQAAQSAVPTGDVFGRDTGDARAITLARLQQQQAPDRQRLALEQRIQLARAGLIKDIGDSRLGAARAATDAQSANADVGLRRASQLGQLGNDTFSRGMDMGRFERDLANDTAGMSERNENRRLDVGRDNIRLQQDQTNFREDADRYGFTSGVNERNAGWRAGLDRGGFLQDRANTLGNRETQVRGQDVSDRNELRGERTFQNNQALDARDNRINMNQFAQWLQSQNIGNATGLFGAGQRGDVGGALGNQAAGFGQQAQSGYQAAGDLMRMLPFLSGRGGAGSAPVIDPSMWSF